jgi:hypothetical protein
LTSSLLIDAGVAGFGGTTISRWVGKIAWIPKTNQVLHLKVPRLILTTMIRNLHMRFCGVTIDP